MCRLLVYIHMRNTVNMQILKKDCVYSSDGAKVVMLVTILDYSYR